MDEIYKKKDGYYNKNNKKITDKKTLDFIKTIYIAPAYKNVIIFKNDNKKLAQGYDVDGRLQIIYRPTFIKKQTNKKYCRMLKFNSAIPKIEQEIRSRLKNKEYDKKKQVAIIVRIIAHCHFRVGSESYKHRYNSFGITTIQSKHVKIINNNITIEFTGKKGIKNLCIINNAELVKHLKNLKKLSTNSHLFHINGKPISAKSINSFIKSFGEFTSKDFRTWYANKYMIEELKKSKPIEDTILKRKKQIKNALDNVAQKLHHTSAICKKSYIDNGIIDKFVINGKIVNYIKYLKSKC